MFPDGRRVVSGSETDGLRVVSGDGSDIVARGVVKVWDVKTGECVATLKGHSGQVRCGVHCSFVMI